MDYAPYAAAPTTCACGCHRPRGVVAPAVDVRDLVEALVACDRCRPVHCPAITANWPWPYHPRPRALVVYATAAADGADGGEGQE